MLSDVLGARVSQERILTQRHLLECYLFLRHFWTEASSNVEHLLIRRKGDCRIFRLKVDTEWLQLQSTTTVEHRLDTMGLVAFLDKNGSAWIRLTATGQEVVTRLEGDVEP